MRGCSENFNKKPSNTRKRQEVIKTKIESIYNDSKLRSPFQKMCAFVEKMRKHGQQNSLLIKSNIKKGEIRWIMM